MAKLAAATPKDTTYGYVQDPPMSGLKRMLSFGEEETTSRPVVRKRAQNFQLQETGRQGGSWDRSVSVHVKQWNTALCVPGSL